MTGFIEQYKRVPRADTSITPRQLEVLEYIGGHIKKYGLAPAHCDFCTHFHFNSTRSAAIHVRAL